ncbi:hypothetical protein [Streptosporangium canum]|uniref:hypothetical protein n=1 Tax=Streptosporangium canum TaxID=324952 RepID=UPI003F4DDCCB
MSAKQISELLVREQRTAMLGQKREHTALGHQMTHQRGGVEKLPVYTLHTPHPEIIASRYKSLKTTHRFSAASYRDSHSV